MLINTILVERTIERESLWERLSIEDLRVLTPLFHGHINPYGQFAFDFGAFFIPRGCLMVCKTTPQTNRRGDSLRLGDTQRYRV
jgi:hypothetical protein